jgi:hypothetical protein
MAKHDETNAKLEPIIEYKDDIDEFVTLVNGCIVELEWRSATYDILYYETHDEKYNTLGMQVDESLTKWKNLRYFLTQCEQRSI